MLLDSFIIDSVLDLFSLTNYLVRMMQAVLQQHAVWSDQFKTI